ncbi:MAG: efflux RND transporter periplasmic adaptor subunit [Clostridium sp.]|jgi:HlyD family secretion protein|nr:efflux RND transporter periplasmic adaptor subunit [Clostridium sp.]
MEENKNTPYTPPKSGEEVEKELEAYMNCQEEKKRRSFFPVRAVRTIRGLSPKKKRTAVILAAAAAVCLAVRCAAGGNALPKVSSMPLEKGDVVSSLSLTGPVSGTDSADVVSSLHSEVLEIRVREGDTVEKGQVLAVIDKTDAQKEVDAAQNAYDLAVSEYNESLRDTKIGYEKAKQDYHTASLSYERNKTLFESGAISSAEFEAAENALSDASRAVEGYRTENGQALPDKSYELKVKAAQFELDQKMRDLEDTEVKSPISGTVVRVNSKVGQFADKPEDEKPMFIIENLSQLEMELQISEYSVGDISVGLPVDITADILDGKTVTGTIASISPTGEEKVGSSSTERVVPTIVSIDKADSGLIAGITARASIVTEQAEHVFKVPSSALRVGEDQTRQIAVLKEGTKTVHFISVDTGVESDLETEIIPRDEELAEGMTILLSPDGLTEGMEVEPV